MRNASWPRPLHIDDQRRLAALAGLINQLEDRRLIIEHRSRKQLPAINSHGLGEVICLGHIDTD